MARSIAENKKLVNKTLQGIEVAILNGANDVHLLAKVTQAISAYERFNTVMDTLREPVSKTVFRSTFKALANPRLDRYQISRYESLLQHLSELLATDFSDHFGATFMNLSAFNAAEPKHFELMLRICKLYYPGFDINTSTLRDSKNLLEHVCASPVINYPDLMIIGLIEHCGADPHHVNKVLGKSALHFINIGNDLVGTVKRITTLMNYGVNIQEVELYMSDVSGDPESPLESFVDYVKKTHAYIMSQQASHSKEYIQRIQSAYDFVMSLHNASNANNAVLASNTIEPARAIRSGI